MCDPYGTHLDKRHIGSMRNPVALPIWVAHIMHVFWAVLYYLSLIANFSPIICKRSQPSFTTMYFPCPKEVCVHEDETIVFEHTIMFNYLKRYKSQ